MSHRSSFFNSLLQNKADKELSENVCSVMNFSQNMEVPLHEMNQRQNESLLPEKLNAPNPEHYDYVLVADQFKNFEDPNFIKRETYISELKQKNFTVKLLFHSEKTFYGVRAPDEIFKKYKYLLKVSDSCNLGGQEESVSSTTRIRIVSFILYHTFLQSKECLQDLLDQKVFETAFCLHETDEQNKLKNIWKSFLKAFYREPINYVKDYFGEKFGLYYLWLRWYTIALIPASVIGLVVFFYNVVFFNTSPLITEVCESDIVMCPRCDKICHVWNLSDTCLYAKLSRLFDNGGTVFYAGFMAVWATLFFEVWKRRRAIYVSEWKIYDWSEEEEELILENVNNPNYEEKKYTHSYLQSFMEIMLVTLMLLVIIALTFGMVVFRIVVATYLSDSKWLWLRTQSKLLASLLVSLLHCIIIQVMTWVNNRVALNMYTIEKASSFGAADRGFLLKKFTFQFFTSFSFLVYVAFFLGRINGYPGNYSRLAGKWRLEECHPSGCLTDLFIQMAVIMLFKLKTFTLLKHVWLFIQTKRNKTSKPHQCDRFIMWIWPYNYNLHEVDGLFSLDNNFLEIVLQFSFTTIFVAAFPLAPLLALINNILVIRLNVSKMVILERRQVPQKTNDIGVWITILEAVGVMAVLANGLVIGISSNFIPRLLYRYRYGPCANGTVTGLDFLSSDCMVGYIESTLSTANMSDANVGQDFYHVIDSEYNVSYCSYRDYRSDEDQTYTRKFWLILAVRFVFVVLFENVVLLFKVVAAWFIPETPTRVNNTNLTDKNKRLNDDLKFFEMYNTINSVRIIKYKERRSKPGSDMVENIMDYHGSQETDV